MIAHLRTPHPYPWANLERVPRRTLRTLRAARRNLSQLLDVPALARVASDLLRTRVAAEVRALRVAQSVREPVGEALQLAFEGAGEHAAFMLELPLDLLYAGIARVLGTSGALPLGDPAQRASIAGAAAAVVVEIARRSGAPLPLRVAERFAATGELLELELTLRIDGRPYEARAWANAALRPSATRARVSLASAGALSVSVPLVVAVSTATVSELAQLAAGDVWLPGGGWLDAAGGCKRGVLAAPGSSSGVAVERRLDGAIVLNGVQGMLDGDGDSTMTNDDDPARAALEDNVLDSPLVVRIELGTVTLLAREWAELRPGDVIETGRRLEEPVVLRVAGREVARGELVNVEGELGVRVQELLTGGAPR